MHIEVNLLSFFVQKFAIGIWQTCVSTNQILQANYSHTNLADFFHPFCPKFRTSLIMENFPLFFSLSMLLQIVCINILIYVVQSAPEPFKNYAEMGVCEDVSEGTRRCAIQSSDCNPTHIDGVLNIQGERWYNAYALRSSNDTPENCYCDNTPVGSCETSMNDPNQCAPKKIGYCSPGAPFQFSEYNDCTCAATKYGACQDLTWEDNHFCAYSHTDCESQYNHIWVEPNLVEEVTGLVCTCENVRVGGCRGVHEGFYCAVTVDDCGWDDYFPPISLKDKHGFSCNLCESSSYVTRDEIDEILNTVLEKKSGHTGMIITMVALVCAAGLSTFYIYRKNFFKLVPVLKPSFKNDRSGSEKPITMESAQQPNESGVLS